MRIELASPVTLVSGSPVVRKPRSPGQCCRSRAGYNGEVEAVHAKLPGLASEARSGGFEGPREVSATPGFPAPVSEWDFQPLW